MSIYTQYMEMPPKGSFSPDISVAVVITSPLSCLNINEVSDPVQPEDVQWGRSLCEAHSSSSSPTLAKFCLRGVCFSL